MKKKKEKKLKGIRGWLLVMLLAFIFLFLESMFLLKPRISSISASQAGWGVYISFLILFTLLIFSGITTLLIVMEKKKAPIYSIFTMCLAIIFAFWYDIIGQLLFFSQDAASLLINLADFLVSLVIAAAIIFYFKKSRRVKNTLVK